MQYPKGIKKSRISTIQDILIGDKGDTCNMNLVIKCEQVTRMVPCYTCLTHRSFGKLYSLMSFFFFWITTCISPTGRNSQNTTQTSIHIHAQHTVASISEQYTNHRKISKRDCYTILRITTNTVARDTLIEATVEKLQLPRDLPNMWKINYRLHLC